MLLNRLLFNSFTQVFLLLHQLLTHCQDRSAGFLMLGIFVPGVFGRWGAGKEAGAIAPLLPSDSIFLYRIEPCCKTTFCFGIRDCSFLPIMRWTSQDRPLIIQCSYCWNHETRCLLRLQQATRSLLFSNHLLWILSFIQTALLCI